jgi:hypothetical protein
MRESCSHRADLAGLHAAEQIVELGERGVVERAVGLVDVDGRLFAEVLRADRDVAGRLLERLGAQRRLRGVVALEDGLAVALLAVARPERALIRGALAVNRRRLRPRAQQRQRSERQQRVTEHGG